MYQHSQGGQGGRHFNPMTTSKTRDLFISQWLLLLLATEQALEPQELLEASLSSNRPAALETWAGISAVAHGPSSRLGPPALGQPRSPVLCPTEQQRHGPSC